KQFSAIDVIAEDLSVITTIEVTAGAEYTFTMPAQNVTVTVTLEDIPAPLYDIAINVIGGTADVVTNPADEAEEAELITVTISNIEVGKQFLSIDVIGEDLTPITTTIVNPEIEFTFVMPAQAVEINVIIEDIPVTYQITTTVMGGTATVVTAPASIAEENDNVIVSISNIESGKIFGMIEVWADDIEINTTEVFLGIEYTFTMPAHDVAIYVHLQDEIIEPIIINTQPESALICEYDFATLTVDATATYAETLEYQWYFNETILTDSIENSIIVNTAGDYYCLLTAGLDQLETEIAVITVATVNPTLLPTISACTGSTIELNPGEFSSYEWQDESTEQILEVTENGTYSVTVTNENGCTASVETIVSFEDEIVLNLGDTIYLCEGSNSVITGPTYADTYEWGEGEDTQEITVTVAGWYYLTITQATCTANDSVLVEIVALPEEFDLGESIFACDGTTVTIEGPEMSDVEYLWNTDETTQDIAVTETGTYSLTVTNEYGCERSDDIDVEFNDFIVPNLHTSDSINACEGDIVTLDPQEGIEWLWSDSSTESSLEVETSGWYYVTVTVTGGCEGSDSVYVFFRDLPLIDLGANQAFCDGESAILTAPEAVLYAWNTGDSLQSITIDTAGVYVCTITDEFGCSNSDHLTLNIYNLPGVNLGTDIIADETQVIILGVETGHPEYLWSSGATTDFIVVDASTLGIGEHTFSVTVTSANECVAEDEIVITVIPGAGVDSDNIKSISIYPNPTNGIINISGNDIISIDIFDNAGKHILTTEEQNIDLSDLAKGMYFIKINTTKNSLNSKIIIE
ncbi:MAG TPA: T9SS type A sorting domain-containing protein, partial [Bacteroidales bacterium]|nr:T9SS type A sorting domain-containing protein [Bacteroidales bacterium]